MYYPDTKPDKDIIKNKITEQQPNEYICKNPEQNTSK